jgi:serine protease Do
MTRPSHFGPAVAVVITLVATLYAGPRLVRTLVHAETEAQVAAAAERLGTGTILDQIAAAQRDIAVVVEPSVVHVSTEGSLSQGRRFAVASTGSGWIWDELGHVVTNAHVVEAADTIEVQLHTGEVRGAEIVGLDLRSDIAVLKIPPGGLIASRRGDSGDVQQGDLVYAFGSPFDFRFSMSSGIVSGLGRSGGLEDVDYENFIQVDAAINPGNSGGPLTDVRGRVIGMNTAIATSQRNTVGQGQFAGIGLAIPMGQIRSVVEQVIETGVVRKGFLGVGLVETDAANLAEMARTLAPSSSFLEALEAIAEYYEGDGVAITRLEPGHPADEAGLQVGDVIETVGGRTVHGLDQLRAMISSIRPGETTVLGIWRFDPAADTVARLEVEVVLGELDPMLASMAARALSELGLLEYRTSTPESAADLGVEHQRGVIVVRTDDRTRLAGALPPGTIIVEAGGRKIGSADELLARLDRHLDAQSVRFRRASGSGFPVVAVRPDGERIAISLAF